MALEEIVQSMIDDGRSEEEIASVISEHDNIEKIDNNKVFKSPSEDIDEVETVEPKTKTEVPALEEPAMETDVEEIKVTDLTKENETKKRRFKDKVKSILGPMNVSTELQDNVVRLKELYNNIDIDAITESSKKTTADSYFQINQIKRRQGFDLSHLSDEFLEEEGLERQIPFKKAFFDYYKNEQGYTKKDIKKLWKEYEQYEKTDTLPDNDFVNNEIMERVNKEKGRVTGEFFKDLNKFEISEVEKYLREVENKADIEVSYNPLIPEEEGGDGQFESIVTNIESRITQLQNQYDISEEKGFGQVNTKMKGDIKEELDGLKQELELFKNKQFRDLKLIPQIFEATNYGGDAIGNINNGRSNQETYIYNVDFPEVEVNDKQIVITPAQANLNLVKDIFSQTIDTDSKMLEKMGETYWTDTIENFEKYAEEQGYEIWNGTDVDLEDSDLLRGSDKYYGELIKFIGEDKTKAYKNYLNWVAKKSQVDGYVDPQGWMKLSTFDINEDHTPTNWFGIEDFQRKYNTQMVHLFNEKLTPTEILDYQKSMYNVTGFNLYNEWEQERIKDEDTYRKLTGKHLLQPTTYKGVYYEPRINMNPESRKSVEADLRARHSFYKPFAELSSYDINRVTNYTTRKLNKHIKDAFKRIEQIEKAAEKEMEKYLSSVPKELTDRLGELMDMLASYPTTPTTKEDIRKYNDIILEAQAIDEAMEETGINDLHKRLKYLKNLLEVEIETLVEICEITDKQEPIRRIAGTNYNDWDLAIHNIEKGILYPLGMLVRDVLLLDRTQQITKHNNLGTRVDINGNLVHAFRPSNTFNVDFDNTTFRGSFFSNLFTWDTRIQGRLFADAAPTLSIISFSALTGGTTASWLIPFFATGYGNEVFKLENRRNEAKKYIDFYKAAYNLAETEEDKFYYGNLMNEADRMSNLSEFDIYASGIYKGLTEVLTEYTLGYGFFLRRLRRFNNRRLAGGAGLGNLVSLNVVNHMSNVSQEVLVEILHNGWDKYYLGDDISLFKGLDERRWWDNTVWTTLVIQGPGTVRQSLNVFNDAVSTQRSRAKQRELAKELHGLLETKKEIMEDESGSRLAELEEINKRISEVLEESNMINFMNLSELDELTMEEMKEAFSIQRQIDERVSRLSSMAEAFGPDKKLRDKLVQEITELQNKKDKILNKESDKTIEDTKDAANPGVAAYNWGLTKFYNRAIKAMAEQDEDLNYYELDYKIVHLGKFDKDGNKIYELTEKDKAAIRKRFPKDANVIINGITKSFAVNEGNSIYVFTNNQLNAIKFEFAPELSLFPTARRMNAAYATVAALHEYIHYYLFKKGLVTYEYDFDVTETEEGIEAVEEVESTSLEADKIKKKRILNESLRESLEELDRYLQGKLTNKEMELVRNRIAKYKKENNNQDDYEEFVMLLSDLLATGYITKTDINAMFHVRSFFQGLAEFVGLDYGFGNLFKRPEDIVTYLESLQRKINAGKLKVILDPEEEKEVKTKEDDHVVMMSIMENLASEVDAIWAKDGVNGTVDIISLYGGVYNYDTGAFDVIPNSMLDRAIRKYRGFPSFDYNELANAFVTEKRGLMEMITKEYNAKHKKQKDSKTTEKEATLSMFLNKFWPERIKQIAVDVLKQEFEPEITEKTTKMIDEDGNMDFDFFIDNQIDLQLATVLGVEERIKEKIREAVEKTFGTKLPAVTSLKFKTVVNDAVRAELNGVIRELMGGRSAAKFKAFLESNYTDKGGNVIEVWKAIYDAIPQSILNKSFQAFIEPVLDEQGRQVRPDNNRLFKRKDITKEEFLDFFFGENVGRSTQGTRKTGLINALAVTLSRHYVIDHLEDSKNLEKTENINELQGHQKVDNYLARVTEALDLNPENKLSIMELTPGVIDEVSKLRDFVSENGETKGSDMAPLLDKYLDEEVDDKFKGFMGVIIEDVKNIFDEYGSISMEELAKAIDSKFGQNIGFEFFPNFNEVIKKLTNGEVKLMDLKTKEGEKRFFELMGELSETMDPRFLDVKTVRYFFSGNTTVTGFSSGTRVNSKGKTVPAAYSMDFMMDKLIRNTDINDFVKYNETTKEFELVNVETLTPAEEKKIEEVIIAWNKDMGIDHDSSIEIAKLADKINESFNLNERREGIEFARDYLYKKINAFVNQHEDGTKERLEAISFVARLLQYQTNVKPGLSRQGAFLSSFTLDFSETEARPFQWEHNIQLLNFNANVLKSIIDGKFDERYETLSSKYVQSLLDKDAQIFLDGKNLPTEEFKAKYKVDFAEIEKYRGKTGGAPGFTIGMESEALWIVALSNASRTVDLRTGLTMDRVIYNKINTKRAVDYLDGIAERIRSNAPNTRNNDIVFNPMNESKIFSNKFNTDLFNDIISSLVIGEDATEKIDILANSIRTQNAKDIKDYKVINKITENNKIENEEQDEIDKVVKMSLAGEFNGASLFDFDGTVGESDNVVIATKDGETRTLDGVQWAEDGLRLIQEGWEMDFSDFNNVTNGKLGPLWQKLINQLIKYGNQDVYILTARAPEVQDALFKFINGEIDKHNEKNNTNVPHMIRGNIVGLGDSTGKAKADWIKNNLIFNGFNDIYFVDDMKENVDEVQDMFNEFPEGIIRDGGKSVLVDANKANTDNKVIFLVGGPGAGKSNIVNQLGLGKNYVVLNPDAIMEPMLKKAGLPLDQSLLETKEQRSQWAKIQQAAIKDFKAEIERLKSEGKGIVIDGTGASSNVMQKRYNDFESLGYDIGAVFVNTSLETALDRNSKRERSLRESIVTRTWENVQENIDFYKELFGNDFFQIDTDNIGQFDVLPLSFTENVSNFTLRDNIQEDDVDYAKYSLSESFNIIIEESTGIEAKKRYSDVQANLQGKRKWWNKLNILTDPGAEDFKGLLYSLLSPGKEGERQMEWFKRNLIDPYDKGVAEMEKERIRLLQNYKEIIKGLPKIKKKLQSKIKREDGKDSYLTLNQAVRVWIWTKNGVDMTAMGLSKRDLDLCLKTIESDPELKTFADALRNISSEYSEPSQTWITGSIANDIKNMSERVSRQKHLETFIKNKNEIFSKDNMNKLRVIQGDDYVEFLEEMLDRMENGNRSVQGNTISRTEREFNEWVNNSVGAIMFLNMRSAVLQLLSTTNFIDMGYNHPLKAAKAVTTKEYWINFLKIWNSDWLKSRAEKGGRTINEEELIEAITGSKNPISSFIALCLEKGFTPTSIADRLAITFGGASYLTNGVKHYMDMLKNEDTMREIMGDGVYTTEEIEKAAFDLAFLDLQQKSNESQQSSDPRFISSIQAGGLGRVLFAFKNTPMQYTRLMKRSMQDLLKGRGNSAQHIAKIAYYGAIQNFIFSALQTALFAALDQSDDEWDKKSDRVIQQMIDSILVGLGLKGAIIVTVKNGILTYLDQDARGWNADHTYTILQFANFSPTIGSKLRKVYSSIKGEQLNEDVIAEMNLWDPRNPAWASVANLIEAFTNLPAARVNNIINSLLAISADENEFMDNLMLVMGWNPWDLGIETESKKVKKELKSKKEKAKEKEKEKKKQKQVQEIVNKQIEEHKEEIKSKPEEKKGSYKCSQVNKEGNRCKIEVNFPGDKCTYHEDVPIRKDGKKTQCKKIKSNGKRCGNKTMATSGLCPIHD